MKIQLADQDAEIEPVPTSGGGRMPEPEIDRLSNILQTFNERFIDEGSVSVPTASDIPRQAQIGAEQKIIGERAL